MNPLWRILQFCVGDLLAKTLSFVAFIFLARMLGVANYGTLEFALSILAYFLLLGDGGLEFWATREIARGADIRQLAGQILPLRLLLAVGAAGALLTLTPFLPDYPDLKPILVLFGLMLFTQAANLKWVFMGQERAIRVAQGLVLGQVVFSVAVLTFVHSPAGLLLIPILKAAGNLAMAVYFMWRFTSEFGRVQVNLSFRNASTTIRSSLSMGAAQGLALLTYNFDAVLLGFMLAPSAVGWYSAAYKPVIVMLALPVSFFLGLFPVLSRTYSESREEFLQIVTSALRLTSTIALPIGVGGIFLAHPIIHLLFGPAYAKSVLVFQILACSAVPVILRGTYRQALRAAGRPNVDLQCAATSAGINLCLNLLLIPHYGIAGAAVATLLSEVFWLTAASHSFCRYIERVSIWPLLMQPAIAAIAMAAGFVLTRGLFWPLQALISLLAYFGVLLLLSLSKQTFDSRSSKRQSLRNFSTEPAGEQSPYSSLVGHVLRIIGR